MNNHENCINKEKIINALRHRYKLLWDKITQSTNSDNIYYLQAKIFEIEDWIEKIENGEFDNILLAKLI